MAWKTTRLVFSLLLAVPSVAIAGDPVFSLSQLNPQDLYNPPFTLGYEFSSDTSFTVDALGFFDGFNDGLAESHEVGLWDPDGDLLASAVVGSGTSSQFDNFFRYTDITPITLPRGIYTVGAIFDQGDEPLIFDGSTIMSLPGFTYIGSTFASGSTLQFPYTFAPTGGFFGPNFEIVTGTPEPAAWATIGIGAALALLMAGRRRDPKSAMAAA